MSDNQINVFNGMLITPYTKKIINTSDLEVKNNYFENTDLKVIKNIRVFIDIDGNASYNDYQSSQQFEMQNDDILEKLKTLNDVSIISSSHYRAEKWIYDKYETKTKCDSVCPKFSYRLTYINEYCDNKEDLKNIVQYEKVSQLQKLLNNNDNLIGWGDADKYLLNIDDSVYNENRIIRCTNAYKYKEQKERINKLIKGSIQDTVLSYIPETAIKRTFTAPNKPELKPTIKIYESTNKETPNELLIKILDGLDVKRWSNYNDWLSIYFIFINENFNIDIFNEYSKKSNKYVSKEANEQYLRNITIKDGLKVATLWFYLKEDNKQLFKVLQRERQDIFNIMSDMNHSDLAKLYYCLVPDKYVRSNISGWYEYNEYNVLQNRGKEAPSSLLNNLTNRLQEYFKDHFFNYISADDANYNVKVKLHKKCYVQLGNATYIKGIIEYLKNLYLIENLDDLIDAKPHLLAFSDKVFDIKLRSFRNIEANDYITITTRYKHPKPNNKFDENIKKVDDLINSIFEEKEMAEYYKIITGLGLFTTKLQSLYIHTGSGGNGKGILSNFLRVCLGDYFLATENTFLTSSFKASQPNPTLASAKSIKYLFISEPDDTDGKFNVDFIKIMTGGDPITTRALHKNNITYIPQFSPNVQCNNKPKLGKLDKGILRRVKIIPYKLSFVDNPKKSTERKRDYNIADLINDENFRDAFIMTFLLKAGEYYNKNYNEIVIPSDVKNETADYFNDNNPVSDWIQKRIIQTDNEKDRVLTTAIHKAYNDDDVEVHLNATDMSNHMKYNNFEVKKSDGLRYYIKCKLIPKVYDAFNDDNDNMLDRL